MNKKVKNATPLAFDGINFKSKLEMECYKTLKDNGFSPLYECKHYTIFKGFIPKVPFYSKNIFKRKNKRVSVLSSYTAIDSRKVLSWVYTPDFYFEYKDYIIHVEIKGFYNDIARYKSKLFRWQLEEFQNNDPKHVYEFWEVHTKKQLIECINHIKET